MTFRFILIFIFTNLVFIQIDAQQEQLIHSAEVYFDFGKHDLRPSADSTLRAVAQIFLEKENRQIKITAHTDSIGSLSNNQALSQRRGNAVVAYLAEAGVPKEATQVSVFGETKPATANATDEGRQRNRRATIEIFESIPMTTLEGQVKDPEDGGYIVAEVIIRGKSFRDSLTTDSTGFFQTEVPTGEVIGVDVIAKGFFLESQMMKVKPRDMPLLEIMMRPATVGEMADIENLYFVGNKDTLLKKSEPTLPKVLRFMQVNEDLKIEIAGHVNHPNSPPLPVGTWEHDLSERRAKRVYNYLVEHGISPERMTWKGYSNWEMRYPRAFDLREQAANRRVEIRVIE